MIDQETQVEGIENNTHYIILMNYLEVDERKAWMKENGKSINDFNSLVEEYKKFREEALNHVKTLLDESDKAKERYDKIVHEYKDVVKHYDELKDKYEKDTKVRERKEVRCNRSRYRS